MSFNADQFMNTTYEDALDTRIVPCPPGEWRAQIEEVEAREIEIKQGDNAGQKRLVMDVTYKILDENAVKETGRDTVLVRQGIFLDLTESGNLDFGKGKNVKLGRLREALGQNMDGQPWAPGMLKGGMVIVEVTNELRDGEVYDGVKKVLPLA